MAVKRCEANIDVVKAAEIRIKNVFGNGLPVFFSFSGGKDSLCVAQLMVNLANRGEIDMKQLTVQFIDEEAIFPCMEDMTKKWRHIFMMMGAKFEGAKDMKLIVPKATAKKLISMGVIDDVTLTYTKNSAVFKSDEYTVYTRLIEGKYFAYQKMFTEGEINTCASRTALIGAMTRAKMCTEEKQPAVFQIEDDVLNISIRDKFHQLFFYSFSLPSSISFLFSRSGTGIL